MVGSYEHDKEPSHSIKCGEISWLADEIIFFFLWTLLYVIIHLVSQLGLRLYTVIVGYSVCLNVQLLLTLLDVRTAEFQCAGSALPFYRPVNPEMLFAAPFYD